MKHLLLIGFILITLECLSQKKVNPVIKEYGGIYDIPTATLKPDSTLSYRIVVDLVSGSDPKSINSSLNNVARMINLHAIGGVPSAQINVVVAIHGGATKSVLKNEIYQEKHGADNPNIDLIRALTQSGVKIAVCGQSLIGRQIGLDQVIPEVEIATSMLTTVAMYQMRGYVVFKF